MKISIITINLNNQKGLLRTIQSVLSQIWQDFEYIIIDGASHDGSLDLIEQHQKHLTYWVSEPDNGIYHAMNKAIVNATGDFCLFMNSGDYFFTDESLKSAQKHLSESKIYYFNYHNTLHSHPTILPHEKDLSFAFFLHSNLCHQAIFYPRKTLIEQNLFREHFQIISDWALNIDLIMNNKIAFKHINETLTHYDGYGLSNQPDCKRKMTEERTAFLQENYSRILHDFERLTFLENVWQSKGIKQLYKIHLLYRSLRTLIQRIISS